MRIRTEGKNGIASMQLNGKILELIRGMPGKKRWRERDLVFEMTAANIDYIKEHFPDAKWEASTKRTLEEIDKLRRAEEDARIAKRQMVVSPSMLRDFKFKTKPFEHQAKAFLLSRDKSVFGLLMEMGTGKTKVIIDTAAYLYAKGEIDVVLVAAPNGVHRNWVTEEIPTHLPGWCPAEAAFYSSTLKAKQKKRLEIALASQALRFITMNIEALSHDSGVAFAMRVLTSGRALFVIDESTRIKKPSARRTKAAHKLAPLAPYRRIMSGAIITKGVEDLYAQFKFLDLNILGFSTFAQFRYRYCIMGGFEMRQIVAYKNLPELQKRVDGHSFRVTKDECLDLPPKVYRVRPVDLTMEQKALYQQAKTDALIQIGEKIIDVSLTITLLLRLQQIICGHLPTADGGGWTSLPNNRVDALMEEIQDAEGKVIVWARFLADLTLISNALDGAGIDHVTYSGQDHPDRRAANVKRFQTDTDCRVFLGNPQAGGIGLTLTAASTVIYYSSDFNAETRWQSEDRAHRIGQKKSVTYIDLVADGTVDKKITDALKKKKNVADLVLEPNFLDELKGE